MRIRSSVLLSERGVCAVESIPVWERGLGGKESEGSGVTENKQTSYVFTALLKVSYG